MYPTDADGNSLLMPCRYQHYCGNSLLIYEEWDLNGRCSDCSAGRKPPATSYLRLHDPTTERLNVKTLEQLAQEHSDLTPWQVQRMHDELAKLVRPPASKPLSASRS